MLEDSETQGPQATRRRAPKACDDCHRKKVKCNSNAMPNHVCSNCLALKIDCQHTTQNQKRGPKAGFKRKPPSDGKKLVYQILAAPRKFIIPEDPEAIRDMLVGIATYARTLETDHRPIAMPTSSSTNVRSLTCSLGSNQTSTDDDEEIQHDVVDSLTRRVGNINLGTFCRRPVIPASQILLQAALDIRDELNGTESRVISSQQKRTEFWTLSTWHKIYEPEEPVYVFPEDGLMQKLVSLFFSNINSYFPLMNSLIFEKQVFEEKLHLSNQAFAATLLAVCALGSRHCRDPRNLCDGNPSEERSAGWKYFQQIPLTRAKLIQPASLFEIQLYVLASLFLGQTPFGDVVSSLVGMGIQSSQEVGAHIKQPLGKTHQERVERELWKRAYWVLVALDHFRSGSNGHPSSTAEDVYDLDFPIECDDEYWIESDTGVSFVQPTGRPSYVEYWTHFLRLVQLAGRTQYYMPSIRRFSSSAESPELVEKNLMELGTEINKWIDAIPDHFSYISWNPHNPHQIFFRQSAMLQTGLLFFQMRVHSWWIRPGPVSSLSFSSLSICTHAARSFIRVLVGYHKRPNFVMLPHMMPTGFLAAVLLLMNIWKQTWLKSAFDPGKDLAQVHACINIMSLYEKRYESPGRFRDVLQSVISASQIPSLPRPNLLKRTRDGDAPHLGSSAPFDMSTEVPAMTPTPSSGLFDPPGHHDLGLLSHSDETGNLGISEYDQENWDTFMTMVDDLLSQTANQHSDYYVFQ